MKTVYQLIQEERERQNPKIKTLIIKLSNGDHCFRDVSNYIEDDSKFEFDTKNSHYEVWGGLVLKETTL